MINIEGAGTGAKQNGQYQGPIQHGIIPINAPLPDHKVEVPETPDKAKSDEKPNARKSRN